MLANYVPVAWFDRLRVGHGTRGAPLARRARSVPLAHLSLDGRAGSFTRSSGSLAALGARSPAIEPGEPIDSREAFERAVARLVPQGSQRRLIESTTIDFATHRVVLIGFRVPAFSSVGLASVRESDARIEIALTRDQPRPGPRGRAAGLIWFALPCGVKPIAVLPFARSE